MFNVLWQPLVVASGGWVAVGSILITLLLLGSENGLRKGMGYVLGYCLSYTIIGQIFVFAQYGYTASKSTGPSLVGTILYLIFGTLFLTLGFRKWRNPPNENAGPPKFLTAIHKLSALKAFGIGNMVAWINFKNLAIYLSAVSMLNTTNLSIAQTVLSVFIIMLTFCITVIIPVILFMIFAEKVMAFLNRVKEVLETHSHPIGLTALGIFGTLFVTRGIYGLL